ncbi:hypothetical protein D1872_81740 [compost metagenome]
MNNYERMIRNLESIDWVGKLTYDVIPRLPNEEDRIMFFVPSLQSPYQQHMFFRILLKNKEDVGISGNIPMEDAFLRDEWGEAEKAIKFALMEMKYRLKVKGLLPFDKRIDQETTI